ncbi:pseudouridine synthase deg1 [Basidiobolus ranarum]|uniref:tRNA pseudouridine synthase n=1 Tax=Basidiobolus ranarum TaxID=34480 RepID=A0ABR2WBK5_9FUNG
MNLVTTKRWTTLRCRFNLTDIPTSSNRSKRFTFPTYFSTTTGKIQTNIALKVSYLGWDYHGFARHDPLPTIEGSLFTALKKTGLIESVEQSKYSRCGRTDAGVSAFSQVIGLEVKLKSHEETGPKIVSMLNSNLPKDIQVISWAYTKPNFDARHDCISRTYKYYFPRQKLNLDLMKEAGHKFLGTKDFRNFCKVRGAKQLTQFKRTIFQVSVEASKTLAHLQMPERQICELTICGRSFLWHQVRCMTAILFLVGQGLEAPSIVDTLLNIEETPSKPHYEMASELPLVLYDSEYQNLNWNTSTTPDLVAMYWLQRHLEREWQRKMNEAIILENLIDALGQTPVTPPSLQNTLSWSEYWNQGEVQARGAGVDVILGGGSESRVRKYTPLTERQHGIPVGELNKQYLDRKKFKLSQVLTKSNENQ